MQSIVDEIMKMQKTLGEYTNKAKTLRDTSNSFGRLSPSPFTKPRSLNRDRQMMKTIVGVPQKGVQKQRTKQD